MSQGQKIGLAIAAIAIVLAVGAFVFIQQRSKAPSTSLVRDAVEKIVANPQLKLTNVTSTVTPSADPGHVLMAYQAEAEAKDALYEAADTTALLRDELKLDPAAWQRTRKVLSGKTAPRILELAGLKGLDPALLQTTFLHETTARGAKFSFSGTLRATKGAEGWQLESERAPQLPDTLRGKPRSAFEGSTTLVDDPAEMKKIRELAAAQADVPAKVEAGRQAFLEERRAAQEKTIADLVDSIKPGTLYGGTATADSGAPFKTFLEFTNLNPRSKQVSAVLRTDGSWSDKRAMKGTFAFDADSESLMVTLATNTSQAVPDAGELLADPEDWRVVLQLSAGKLYGYEHRHSFTLNRLSETEATAARKEIEAASLALLSATETGKIYRGVVRSRETPETFDYLLRFNQQDREAATLVATLEPAGREALQRTYRGTVAANRRQPGGPTLRLESSADDAIKTVDGRSPLGLDHEVAISLQLVDGHLKGGATDFSYDFAPLSDEDVAKLAVAAAEREKSLLAIVKADTAYPGVAHLEGNSLTEKIRLRFRRVDAHGATVDAVIESLDQAGIFREFRGSVDAFAGKLSLNTVGKGRASAGRKAGLTFPPLAYSDGQLLVLDISPSALSGELSGSGQGWKLNFPVAGATEVSAGASDFPTDSGAYVWSGGAWQPLPRNDGKVSKSTLKAIGGFLNSLGKSSSAPSTAEKLSDLVFSGHDPLPAAEATDVRVIYVGTMKTEQREKYSQLASYPELEVATTTRDSGGNRKVVLTRIASGVPVGGFNERRMPGNLERISDTVIELTISRQLAPGTYAVSVNEEAYEFKVE